MYKLLIKLNTIFNMFSYTRNLLIKILSLFKEALMYAMYAMFVDEVS